LRADRCVFCEKQGRSVEAQAPASRRREKAAPKNANHARVAVLGAGAMLVVMGATVALFLSEMPEVAGDPDAPDVVYSNLGANETTDTLEITETTSESVEEEAIDPEPRLVVPSSFALRFEGRVRTTSGMDVKRRAKCALEAQVRSERVSRVTLLCDDAIVYDSEMPMAGFSSRGSELYPRHEDLEPRFALDFYDMGQRTGRPSIRVSSTSKSIEVFDVLRPGAIVSIKIDEIGEMVPPSD
jgi:hypothetical protein